MLKKIICCVLLCCIGTISFSDLGHAQSLQITTSAQSRAEITGWRYKKENGHVYKRLYNYSTGKWIGSWIVVS